MAESTVAHASKVISLHAAPAEEDVRGLGEAAVVELTQGANQQAGTQEVSLAADSPTPAPAPAPAPSVGPTGRVLSVTFDPVKWPVTADRLHQVAATYGAVCKIHVTQDSTSALVLYVDANAAHSALTRLQNFAFYGDGNNVMTTAISDQEDFSVDGNENSKEFGAAVPAAAAPPSPAPAARDSRQATGAGTHASTSPLQLTGEEYVRAHEKAMEQCGYGRAGGRGGGAGGSRWQGGAGGGAGYGGRYGGGGGGGGYYDVAPHGAGPPPARTAYNGSGYSYSSPQPPAYYGHPPPAYVAPAPQPYGGYGYAPPPSGSPQPYPPPHGYAPAPNRY